MAQPVVVDLRNIYRPEDMAAHGFVYESVGRASEPRSDASYLPPLAGKVGVATSRDETSNPWMTGPSPRLSPTHFSRGEG